MWVLFEFLSVPFKTNSKLAQHFQVARNPIRLPLNSWGSTLRHNAMWLWLCSEMSLVAFVSFVAMESRLRKPRRPTSQAGGRRKKHGVHNTESLYNADLKTSLLKRPSINFPKCCAAPWDTKIPRESNTLGWVQFQTAGYPSGCYYIH